MHDPGAVAGRGGGGTANQSCRVGGVRTAKTAAVKRGSRTVGCPRVPPDRPRTRVAGPACIHLNSYLHVTMRTSAVLISHSKLEKLCTLTLCTKERSMLLVPTLAKKVSPASTAPSVVSTA